MTEQQERRNINMLRFIIQPVRGFSQEDNITRPLLEHIHKIQILPGLSSLVSRINIKAPCRLEINNSPWTLQLRTLLLMQRVLRHWLPRIILERFGEQGQL